MNVESRKKLYMEVFDYIAVIDIYRYFGTLNGSWTVYWSTPKEYQRRICSIEHYHAMAKAYYGMLISREDNGLAPIVFESLPWWQTQESCGDGLFLGLFDYGIAGEVELNNTDAQSPVSAQSPTIDVWSESENESWLECSSDLDPGSGQSSEINSDEESEESDDATVADITDACDKLNAVRIKHVRFVNWKIEESTEAALNVIHENRQWYSHLFEKATCYLLKGFSDNQVYPRKELLSSYFWIHACLANTEHLCLNLTREFGILQFRDLLSVVMIAIKAPKLTLLTFDCGDVETYFDGSRGEYKRFMELFDNLQMKNASPTKMNLRISPNEEPEGRWDSSKIDIVVTPEDILRRRYDVPLRVIIENIRNEDQSTLSGLFTGRSNVLLDTTQTVDVESIKKVLYKLRVIPERVEISGYDEMPDIMSSIAQLNVDVFEKLVDFLG
jgi:hypothetical protein